MTTLQLSSKAKTLQALKPVLKSASVLDVFRFKAINYKKSANKIISEVQKKFLGLEVIIRSSSASEDNEVTSHAGGFSSVLNVKTDSIKSIDNAIKEVIQSYGDQVEAADEVFVQPMLQNVDMCGVLFTADIDTLSPYYIVNYDESGSTSSVTSGESNDLKTYICSKNNDIPYIAKISELIIAAKECEEIFDYEYLDIEFAWANDTLYILQVRKIVTLNKDNLSNIKLPDALYKLHKKIEKLNAPHPNLLGEKVIFGVMPDWNPAEMIGLRPKRLALSLYKELITDETWAYQRDNYGYRNLRSHPLLVSLLGVPYIDARISFNSFIPKTLNEQTSTKLVNYYLDKLIQNKEFHDKVEFEIIFSCYFFGLDKQLKVLKEHSFSNEEILEIEGKLRSLTNNIINTKEGLYKKDLEKIEILKEKFYSITHSEISLIDKIYWTIKDVKRYGTLPFAGIARAGFIAVQFLRSFITEGVFSVEEYGEFLNSLNTVSKNMAFDFNHMPKEEFLIVYGHLRPGTYDILSQRYDEAFEEYFSTEKSSAEVKHTFCFSPAQKQKIEGLIKKNHLNTNFDELILFIKEAIEGREYAKFMFTKHLSQTLLYMEEFGKRFDLPKAEIAFLDIQVVLSLYSNLGHRNVVDILTSNINLNKQFYEYTKAVKLPPLISQSDDIYHFFLMDNQPNFVTLKSIKEEVITEDKHSSYNLEGKIVCIQSADPGYDYLFSKKIGGLITCYGGANSHMAIRCAEMSIPAVIGCGEVRFTKYQKAKIIKIDAANKQVKVIS